jgi:glycosyltransferase involved in cell wall biosynthesis
MKIIQVIPSFAFGGAEIMCENLIYALRRQGHEVLAVSLFDSRTAITERIENNGIKLFFMGKRPGLDLSMKGRLKRLFKAEKPDVVHVHLNAIKYVAPAAKAAKVSKCVYTVHNLAEKDAGGISQKLNAYFFSHSMATPVALSSTVKESISRVYGICECKIPIVFNGIDLSKCSSKQTYALGERVEILHIGRFFEQKNHAGMLRAFALIKEQHPNAILRLVGDGELRSAAEALASELGIADSVIFEGAQADVYKYLRAADLFILPSLYEGMPITLIEAMGSGLPIVATAVGGVPDMLEDGVSASLCPCDVESIAKACNSLIESEELREKYGRAALERSPEFSAYTMAVRYLEVYSQK